MSGESPSGSLLANLRRELAQAPPFSQMDAAAVDFFITHAQEQYFAPECDPASARRVTAPRRT